MTRSFFLFVVKDGNGIPVSILLAEAVSAEHANYIARRGLPRPEVEPVFEGLPIVHDTGPRSEDKGN